MPLRALSVPELEARSDAQLYERLHRLETAFESQKQSARGVELARQGAQVAHVLAARGVPVASLAAAEHMLEEVLEGAGLVGLCDAGVDLALFRRSVMRDLKGSQATLSALRRRYGSLASERACLARIAAMDEEPGRSVHASGRAPVLQRVEVFGAGAAGQRHVRVVLYLDGAPPSRRSERSAEGRLPRRVLLDLEGATLAPEVPSVVPVGRAGLRELRLFSLPGGVLRATYDLAEQAEYRMFVLESPYRVVFDAALQGAGERTPGQRRVVLDPGHGGYNPGAKGPTGLRESDVALSLARRARRVLLREDPSMQVLLTRDSDVEVTLEERAAIANAADADVFVSIHLNASGSPTDKGGISTFVLDTNDDSQALRLAARENDTEVGQVGALAKVLASLYREDQAEHSRTLARLVHRGALTRGREELPDLPDRGVRRALFYVLVGVTMPAALVEASFITRPDEEQALRSDAYREALASGIARGILDYLGASQP